MKKGRFKVHIFWEGHKILRKLHCRFDWHYIGQIYGGDFAKFCGLLRISELYLVVQKELQDSNVAHWEKVTIFLLIISFCYYLFLLMHESTKIFPFLIWSENETFAYKKLAYCLCTFVHKENNYIFTFAVLYG